MTEPTPAAASTHDAFAARRLDALLSILPVGVFTIGHDQHIRSINPEAARLTGLDPVAAIGRNCREVLRCAVRGCPAEKNTIGEVDVVQTLPLASNSVDVYYIYGSVLSFYGETAGNCEEAAQIFAELRASPYIDATIEGIIREGEVICAAFARRTPTP